MTVAAELVIDIFDDSAELTEPKVRKIEERTKL